MASLIQNADKLGITYKAFALTTYSDSFKPENVFQDNDSPIYRSKSSPANQWWQVSFSEPVSISGYKIRGYDNNYCVKSWIINTSFDNETWETVDDKTNQNTHSGNQLFNFSSPISCKDFRLIQRENCCSNNYFLFRFFDCFGVKGKMKSSKKCFTLYVSYLKYKLFINVFISSLYNSFIT